MTKLNEVQKKVLAAYKTEAPKGFPKTLLRVDENIAWSDLETKTGEGTVRYDVGLGHRKWILLAWWKILGNKEVALSFEPLSFVQEQIEDLKAA